VNGKKGTAPNWQDRLQNITTKRSQQKHTFRERQRKQQQQKDGCRTRETEKKKEALRYAKKKKKTKEGNERVETHQVHTGCFVLREQ
jgi:hypothetical protein